MGLKITEEQEMLLTKIYDSMLKKGSWSFKFRPSSQKELRLFRSLEKIDLVYMPQNLLGLEYYVFSPTAMEILYSCGRIHELVSVLNAFFSKEKISWNKDDLKDFYTEENIPLNEFTIALYFAHSLSYIEYLRHDSPLSDSLPDLVNISPFGELFFEEPFLFGKYLGLDRQFFKSYYSDEVILNWIHHSAASSEDFELEFKSSDDINDLRKIVSCFSNSFSGVLCIGFNDDGTLCGLSDPPDRIRNRVITNLKGISNKDIEYRILTNTDGEKALIVLIARGEAPVLIGNLAYKRTGASCEKIESYQEIIELTKELDITLSGHLWLKSLKKFKFEKSDV
ncbi:MAG: AlbA family DNA-binding domain-containing protein [Candidatus Heimdallarchaeaceae archaeon]